MKYHYLVLFSGSDNLGVFQSTTVITLDNPIQPEDIKPIQEVIRETRENALPGKWHKKHFSFIIFKIWRIIWIHFHFLLWAVTGGWQIRRSK